METLAEPGSRVLLGLSAEWVDPHCPECHSLFAAALDVYPFA